MADDLDKLSDDEFDRLLVGDVPMGLVTAGTELAKRQIVRPAEVMERFRISRATLYRWIKSGHFPRPRQLSIRVTGWPESELVAWFDALEATRRTG